MGANQKLKILVVCMGNICRSPSMQSILQARFSQMKINAELDSAGTQAFRVGSKPDPRAAACAAARGYSMKGYKSRQVVAKDFQRFDIILAADDSNYRDLVAMAPSEYTSKVKRIMSFCDSTFDEVPDPYYGGKKGFELMMDLLEDASDGFIRSL